MEKKKGCCQGCFYSTAEQPRASLCSSTVVMPLGRRHSHVPHLLHLLEMRSLNVCLLINSKEVSMVVVVFSHPEFNENHVRVEAEGRNPKTSVMGKLWPHVRVLMSQSWGLPEKEETAIRGFVLFCSSPAHL